MRNVNLLRVTQRVDPFATNAFLADVPAIAIMKNHRAQNRILPRFMKYIKMTAKDNAIKLQSHKFFHPNGSSKMKPIKNIQNLSVSELLSELYELESDSYIAYIDLYNHFRANTNNFDPKYVTLLIRDMIEYVPKIEFCWDGDIVTLHDLYFNETLLKKYDLNPNDFIYGIGLFDLYRELQECCLEIDSSDDYENGNEQLSYVQFGSHYIEQYARMVDEKGTRTEYHV